MAVAIVTISPVGAKVGLCSNSADLSLQFKKAVPGSKLSAKAVVNSVTLRPGAMGINQSCRRMSVSKLFMTQASSMGSTSMKKVSGHNDFNWPIYATGPGSGGNGLGEPGEEPSVETCGRHDHEDMGIVPDSIKEKVSLDQFMKLKLKIYKQYIEDHLSDGDASAEARDLAELKKEIEEMNAILKLEENYRKAKDEALPSDVLDYMFHSFFLLGVIGSLLPLYRVT